MNISDNYTRRDFLKVVSVAGSGLTLGFYFSDRKLIDVSDEKLLEQFSPNVWITIDKFGITTITVGRSEMGQGVRTSLPMIVAEELEADWSKVKIEQAPADPDKFGSQSTGGSTSVRHSWEMLRKAGATAREMLITAASKQWNVDRQACVAENGSVLHRSSGRKLLYGELAETASQVPIPENPPLKDSKDFRLIGTNIHRLDTPSKVDGSAVFGIDMKIPKMLYGAIARSPMFGGKLGSVDFSTAKKIAGVRDVIQLENSIAVVAENTWAALKGREALVIKWNDGKFSDQSSEKIWKVFQERALQDGTVERSEGDVKTALTNAAKNIESTYQVPFLSHAPMEPMNCLADVREDHCEIWAPTQTPQQAQNEVADILGFPLEKVRVNITLLGGGFGRRLESDYVIEAVQLSKLARAPVKVVWTREDDMRFDYYRPATYHLLRGGLDSDGMPIAWFHRIVGAESKGLATHGSNPIYPFKNLLIESHAEETGVQVGAWRSVGYTQNTFTIESFIDELAATAGKDPVEYRKRLLKDSPRLLNVLTMAAEKADWKTPLPKGRGRGVAITECFGSRVAQIAEVSVEDKVNVRVHRVVCVVDCGTVVNPNIVEAQMEGGIVYGLSAVLKGEITVDKGKIVQTNFDTYELLRMDEMPKVEVHIVRNNEPPGGVGEPGVPAIAPAVTNAIFAVTGKRIRTLPIRL